MKPSKRARCTRVMGLLWLVGCSRQAPGCMGQKAPRPAPPLEEKATAAAVAHIIATELSTSDAGDAVAENAMTELVRREAYQEAAAHWDELPPALQSRPTMKLLRARVAAFLSDHGKAVQLLAGLEHELVPIADDISRFRADSAFYAGPPEVAAEALVHIGTFKAMVKAAIAFDQSGRAADAESAADRAIALGKGEREEATVRALRAKLAEASGRTALAIDDLRFIALRAPASDEAEAAVTALQRLDPSHPLTGKERLLRADKLAEAGRTEAALSELVSAADAPSPADATDVAWARAYTLYKAKGRYQDAAAAFAKLGAGTGPRQSEALFYAARALSRADHDAEAQQGYRALVRRLPTSPWSDDAQYLSARLSYLHGAWDEAARGYARYLSAYPSGKQRDAAAYERALALLLAGQPMMARTELHALALSAPANDASRLRELEGVAALQGGDSHAATILWTEVSKALPLSWPATVARARLLQQGAALPPLIDVSDDRPEEPLRYTAPPVVELYHRLGLEADADNYLRAHEREVASDPKGREREALCALYGDLGRAARRYRIASEAVPTSVLLRAPSPASQWAWNALYPKPYVERVRDIEAREKLPQNLVYAVMRQESAFDPDALSPARAVGLLQLMPDTARRVAAETETPFDEQLLRAPSVNIDLGARYLAKMLRTFEGSIPLAAAAYNAGPRAVQKWLSSRRALELDLWVALIPYDETRTYVGRVMSNLGRYRFLEGGEAAVEPLELTLPKPKDTRRDEEPSSQY